MKEYLLIGAGGTGGLFIGPALIYLNAHHTNHGEEWHFTVVDGDAYEETNLVRQFFDPRYLGSNKANAVAEEYTRYPITPIPEFVGYPKLRELMSEGIVVFIGADNHSLRAEVEKRALELQNCIVINAGNEYHDGSVQLWVREGGENKTPRLSYGHPEIAYTGANDRSFMSCMEITQLPSGEQLIIANMAAAQHMLAALWRYHNNLWIEGWTELQFDLMLAQVDHINMRERRNWAT